MTAGLLGVAIFAIAAGVWTISTYNVLVKLHHDIENAFASVDVAAKKRYDLVPNLVACVKGYMEHERALLAEVVELRTRAQAGGMTEGAQVEYSDRMSAMLSRMMLLTEGYPELKADGQFLNLQRTLTELEEQLSATRRFFNSAVTRYNEKVQSIPTNLVAPRLGFPHRTRFQIDAAEQASPEMDLSAPSARPELMPQVDQR